MANRLKSLDWLRGSMALSIMLYHLRDRYESATVLGRLGTYGVSIFFILSGLSMAIAYDRFIRDLRSSGAFFIRRLFRIWPLLWLAIAVNVVSAYHHGRPPGTGEILLNLTTAFGFVSPGHYMTIGAWSIGNEMVYYTLTPLLIAAFHFRKGLGNSITVAAFLLGMVFAFRLLDPHVPIADQWAMYVNPLNNLFLYCIGLTIYYTFRDAKISNGWYIGAFVCAAAVFVFYPASGDQININVGFARMAFSLASAVVVLVCWKCPPRLPETIGNRFEDLGIATYGVYLLHPIVMESTQKRLQAWGIYEWPLYWLVVVSLTIALALFTFRFYESPLTRLGKRITQTQSENTTAAGVDPGVDSVLPFVAVPVPRSGKE